MTLWSTYSEKSVWFLIILAVIGQKGMIATNFHAWFNTASSAATAGLWASRDERQEWIHVLDLTKDKSSIVLTYDGSAQLSFAELTPPVAVTLMRGQTTASELRRKIEQLSDAQIAIVPVVLYNAGFLNEWPEFKDRLSKWDVPVFNGRYFTVYRRADSKVTTTF